MHEISITIDRIVLADLDVAPHRAERIRASVEAELQRMLAQGELVEGLASGEVSRLEVPPIHIVAPHSDGLLAKGIARSIASALRGGDL